MAKVRELGWEQGNVRGTNCIRLLGSDGIERIAAINFKSFIKLR